MAEEDLEMRVKALEVSVSVLLRVVSEDRNTINQLAFWNLLATIAAGAALAMGVLR